jgi:hypothetical protein
MASHCSLVKLSVNDKNAYSIEKDDVDCEAAESEIALYRDSNSSVAAEFSRTLPEIVPHSLNGNENNSNNDTDNYYSVILDCDLGSEIHQQV